MAMSLNKVQLIGNLTRDPELKQIPGGQSVVSFGIATNFSWKDSSGQQQSKTEFHNLVAWRRLAEIIAQYLKKGSKIYIEGRLQTRDWEGEDGVKRYRTEIVVDNMIMLDSKGNARSMPAEGMNREAAGIESKTESKGDAEPVPQEAPAATASKDEVKIDDLPF